MSDKNFGFWRSIAWPIHRNEIKKIVSMGLMFFFLCICYSMLRNLKDSLNLAASGAEAIPFIKVWGMLPGAIIATWLYTKLRSFFSRENVFYILVSGFVSYYLLYAFVLSPNSEALHLTRLDIYLKGILPSGFTGLISMISNWSVTLFYIISELWSVIVLTVLFWSFANDITPLTQAKRCYGLLNLGSNMAPIFGGGLGLLAKSIITTSKGADPMQQSLTSEVVLVSIFALFAMGIFYWINRKVVPFEPAAVDSHAESVKNSNKKRLSIRDCIRYISKSRYLTCLALIVLGFSISINFTDVLWKAQLKKQFSPDEINTHLNQVTIGIGCIATIGGLLFSIMVRRIGWTFVAMLTPAVMVLMAIGFFSFIFFENALTGFAVSFFGVTPLIMTVYFGSLQNCLSKAGKYSVFDASKELAFLALPPEARIRGKAAIDGLGSGIGKSGSSLTYQALLLATSGSIALTTPVIAGILMVVFAAWIFSVKHISKEFKVKSDAAELGATAVAEELKEEAAPVG
jgi:AAA family ATP:ADP antiporter